jgi:transposase
LATNDSTAGTSPANVDLTNHRFQIDSGSADLTLIGLGMSLATAELPEDIAALRAFAPACQGELKAAQLAVQVKALEIEKLRFQIAKLRRMQFGRSSERITRQIEQLELQLEELETGEAEDIASMEASEPAAPIPQRAKPKRKPLPDHLPRQEVLHQPEADGACICPACGGGMGRLGEDITEVLDYVPGYFQVIRHVRPKYACQACDAITQAPAPAMPTPRGRATPAMLAHLLVSKYCDHLPLYRQCEIYAREGLELERSTLCDWVGQAAWLLAPIVAAIRAHVFAAEKIHGDDTTVPVLAPGLGRTKTGRLWVYVRDDRPFCGGAPPAAAYFYSPDRCAVHPAAHMATFSGLLQADGYAGFEKLYGPARTKPGPITEVACWAHTRRGFFDEWEHHKSPTAKQALDRIAAIYAVEVRAAFAPLAERVELRRDTAPLVDEFFRWAMTSQDTARSRPPARIPCPFVYANGRVCSGHVVRFEAYNADLAWSTDAEGAWNFTFRPRSHFHVFCSEKGNHAGFRRQDPNTLKFWFDTLPDEIQQIIKQTNPPPG